MRTATYAEIRPRMLPCDLIAFSGRGLVSAIIKRATESEISHVGGVAIGGLFDSQDEVLYSNTRLTGVDEVWEEPGDPAQRGRMVLLYESTTLDGANGVRVLRMSDAIPRYLSRGYRVWWYPMRADLRERFDCASANDWLFRQLGKDYDVRQALTAPAWMRWLRRANGDDEGRLFCSEMKFGAWKAGGAWDGDPSVMRPIDCVQSDVVDHGRAVEVVG